MLGRLSYALGPLGMVLLVSEVRDSYGDAGIVTGAYGLGTAVGSPLLGRALDRVGQPRVLVPTGLLCGGLLVAIAFLATADAPLPVLVLVAALAGLVFPPLGPAMRAAWRVVFADDSTRRSGYALDAVAVETIFVVGPLLLSVLVTSTSRPVPLVVTGLVLAGGTVGYAMTAAARRAPTVESAPGKVHEGSVLGVVGIPAALGVVFGLAVAFGSIDTSIAATAREVLDDEGKLGWLFTAVAGGSAIGGLSYGAWATHQPGREQRRIPLPLAIFSLCLVPLALVLRFVDDPTLAMLMPLLFLAGLSIAPTLIMTQNLVDALSPPSRVNEGQAWLTTGITTGAAVGTGVAGLVIDAVGVPGSFGTAAAATGLAAAGAFVAQGAWARRVGHGTLV